jgi:hypothetical protein
LSIALKLALLLEWAGVVVGAGVMADRSTGLDASVVVAVATYRCWMGPKKQWFSR